MDIGRIFDSLRQWSRGLDTDRSALLAKLMAAGNAKGFIDIPADEIRLIQEQLLRSGEDADRQLEMKRAAYHLTPAVSETPFI